MVPLSPEIFTLNLDMPAPPSPFLEAPGGTGVGEPRATAAEEPRETAADVEAANGPEEAQTPVVSEEPKDTPSRPLTRSRDAGSTARLPATDPVRRRRLTLFEQLSLPPPDSRQKVRGRLADPGAAAAGTTNVLKTRLRASSQTPVARRRTRASGAAAAAVGPETPTGKRKREARTIPTAERLGEDPGAYPTGTAVWAKMESYPWFPAETCDPAAAAVPDSVRTMARQSEDTALVQFFAAPPAARQWRWLSPAQICRLGADLAVDTDFFRARKAKSSNMVRNIRLAYAQACDAKGITPLVP
ncbi:hypothetical protein IWQ56_006368 [Coemansia nantahalensis]|nr:hypothetical protein IWQ56_006368 [Coemansia nantahalensis]